MLTKQEDLDRLSVHYRRSQVQNRVVFKTSQMSNPRSIYQKRLKAVEGSKQSSIRTNEILKKFKELQMHKDKLAASEANEN